MKTVTAFLLAITCTYVGSGITVCHDTDTGRSWSCVKIGDITTCN